MELERAGRQRAVILGRARLRLLVVLKATDAVVCFRAVPRAERTTVADAFFEAIDPIGGLVVVEWLDGHGG